MFNGIIKNTGKIIFIKKKNSNCTFSISSKMKFSQNEIGSSISCSGACLTLVGFTNSVSKYYLSKETIDRRIV